MVVKKINNRNIHSFNLLFSIKYFIFLNIILITQFSKNTANAVDKLEEKNSQSKKTITQKLYEQSRGISCLNSTEQEINFLMQKNCEKITPDAIKDADLNEVAENMVFKKLANYQINSLDCSEKIISKLKDDKNLNNSLIEKTCTKLPELQKIWAYQEKLNDNISNIQDKLHSQVKIKKVYANQKEALSTLNKEKKLVEKTVDDLIQSDVLLSIPEIRENLLSSFKSNWIKKAKTPAEVCNQLKQSASDIFNSTLKEISKSKDFFSQALDSKNNKLNNIDFKEKLWEAGNAPTVLNELFDDSKNKFLASNLYCRLNSKYGDGKELMTKLITIAELGTVPLTIELESLSALASASGMHKTSTLARSALLAESITGVAASFSSAQEACLEKQAPLNGREQNCKSLDENRVKQIILHKIENPYCAVAAPLAALNLAGTTAVLRSSLKGKLAQDKIDELAKLKEELLLQTKQLKLDEVLAKYDSYIKTNDKETYKKLVSFGSENNLDVDSLSKSFERWTHFSKSNATESNAIKTKLIAKKYDLEKISDKFKDIINTSKSIEKSGISDEEALIQTLKNKISNSDKYKEVSQIQKERLLDRGLRCLKASGVKQ